MSRIGKKPITIPGNVKLDIKAIYIPNQNYFNWKYRPQQIYYGNQQTKTADHTDILY